MNNKKYINQLISQNYMIKNIHVESSGETTITFLHKGGAPPPQGQYVTIVITDPGIIAYAYKIFNS